MTIVSPPFDQGVECRQQLVDVVEMQPRVGSSKMNITPPWALSLSRNDASLHALGLSARPGNG